MMAQSRELILKAGDGTPLFVIDQPPDGAVEHAGGIVLMHGLGEHCGRYVHIAKFFNDHGWLVRAYDHRGHGRSGGARGDVPDSAAIVRDAKVVIDDLTRRFGMDVPPLLLGHSMGGLFAARFAAARLSPLRGLILSSPALALTLSAAQNILLKALSAIAPGLGVNNGLKTKFLSQDPAVVAAYENDPLVHSKISARLLGAMLEAMDFAQSRAASIDIPTLMVVAGDDRLVDAAGSSAFFANLAPGIGALHRYSGFYHEIFNEPDARRVFADVQAWLDKLTNRPVHSAPLRNAGIAGFR